MACTSINTRILILSDTHDNAIGPNDLPAVPVDVVFHCGDFTNGSKIEEFEAAIALLKSVHTPLKVAIAGNHDFSLDEVALTAKVAESGLTEEKRLVEREYGSPDVVRAMFEREGIVLLDEGTHYFSLDNGARLNLYVSPYTPSLGAWGFQYRPESGHKFDIQPDTDVVMTHGPPKGIMDMTYGRERAGCPELFATVLGHARFCTVSATYTKAGVQGSSNGRPLAQKQTRRISRRLIMKHLCPFRNSPTFARPNSTVQSGWLRKTRHSRCWG